MKITLFWAYVVLVNSEADLVQFIMNPAVKVTTRGGLWPWLLLFVASVATLLTINSFLGCVSHHLAFQILLFTLLYYITKHFCLRTGENHCQLKFTNFHVKRDGGSEIVYFVPHGASPRSGAAFPLFVNTEEPNRCPVNLYRAYAKKWWVFCLIHCTILNLVAMKHFSILTATLSRSHASNRQKRLGLFLLTTCFVL